MITVEALRKDKKQLQLVREDMRKSANNTIAGKMPTIYVATVDDVIVYDEYKTAAVGFRYRRQSHSCEITWWGGRDETLVAECLKTVQCAAILEGRKRVECFNESNSPASRYERGDQAFDSALKLAEFVHEGHHPDWTKDLEAANIWGWVWLKDGLPLLKADTVVRLGMNATTQPQMFAASRSFVQSG